MFKKTIGFLEDYRLVFVGSALWLLLSVIYLFKGEIHVSLLQAFITLNLFEIANLRKEKALNE